MSRVVPEIAGFTGSNGEPHGPELPGRTVVGIGEFAVSDAPADTILTHALGSCVAVCIWDRVAGIGGLLHFLLPDAAINPARAKAQPATFANTGLPLMFHAAYSLGLVKERCQVRLVGGADVTSPRTGAGHIGKKNLLAARSILWHNGLLIEAEETGGTIPRNVALRLSDGAIAVTSGGGLVHQL